MANNKKRSYRFCLEESNREVVATLEDEFDFGMKFDMHEVKPVRVRAPRPTKEYLDKAIHSRKNHPNHTSNVDAVKYYIECRNRGIANQLDEIRRSIKRIQSSIHCVKIAEQIVAEIDE